MTVTQICKKCGIEKTPSSFYKKHSTCIQCESELHKQAYWADPEKYRAIERTRYRQKHPVKVKPPQKERPLRTKPSITEQPTEFKCRCCGETKHIEQFHKNLATRTGHTLYCKVCISDKNKKRSQVGGRYYKTYDPGKVPSVEPNTPVRSVLSYLIMASRKGVNADTILKESITAIQESLA